MSNKTLKLKARIAELEAWQKINQNEIDKCHDAEIELLALREDNKWLKEENRWIPVSERLPEKDGYYLVTDDVWYGRMWFVQGIWQFADRETEYILQNTLTHWMPIILPKQALKDD